MIVVTGDSGTINERDFACVLHTPGLINWWTRWTAVSASTAARGSCVKDRGVIRGAANGYEPPRLTPSTPKDRNSGCCVDSVQACSHGIQNIAATVWFRKVTMERACFPLGHGMST